MNTYASVKKSPLKFFVLVFALIIQFWVLGAVTGIELLPGVPIAVFAFVCPVTAAMILEYRENKGAGVRALLKGSFDFKRIKVKAWYIPIPLLYPVVLVLSFFVIRLTGMNVPAPPFSALSALFLVCCVLYCRFGRGTGLVRICHRPDAGSGVH
jgi:uncharacterized protein